MPILTLIENERKTEIPFCETPTVAELVLQERGSVFTPCGRLGRCGKCEIEIEGEISEPTAREKELGVRLACLTRLYGDARVRFKNQRENIANVLTTVERTVVKVSDFKYGAAVDIGTTTVVLKLYGAKGEPLAIAAATNPQRELASDVIGRISESQNGKRGYLMESINSLVDALMRETCEKVGISTEQIERVVVTGNTAMLHFYRGLDVAPIATHPFKPNELFGCTYGNTYLAPCISAFIGGDMVCALLYSGALDKSETSLLIDIGTNGEIALCKNGSLFVTSCAAGPAFEGGEISCGCGSVVGAVESVAVRDNKPFGATVGNAMPVGICGSGLIDAVSVFLKLGYIDKSGYAEQALDITAENGKLTLTQDDIRAFQLAKSAVRAGIETLLSHTDTSWEEICTIYVAGGFGNSLSVDSAVNVGLFHPSAAEKLSFIGNAALGGASVLLLDNSRCERAAEIANRATVVDLAGSTDFYDRFIKFIDF